LVVLRASPHSDGCRRPPYRTLFPLSSNDPNQIVSKRFVKKQQMQWTKKGAHLLLQMRTQVLDERLEETFRGWYPDFRPDENEAQEAA
jgi:hypothetical protein